MKSMSTQKTKIEQTELIDAKIKLEDLIQELKESQLAVISVKLEPILKHIDNQAKIISTFNRKQHEKKRD